jgi:hypothetical protein
MIDARWEHGSEFHWSEAGLAERDDDRDWLMQREAVGYASGRAALRALVEHGRWPRVWLPSYVCAELIEAVGDRVRFYEDDPTREPSLVELGDEASAGDAIVRINYFGLRGSISAGPWQRRGLVVIDDHTHDPCGAWAQASDADYCLASLRKSLPVPDGALVWSRGGDLPAAPEACDEAAAKLPAMLLKALYLRGYPVEKSVVRALAIAGEQRLAALTVEGMSRVSGQLLASLAISRLRARRRENFAVFAEAIGERAAILAGDGATPFACVLRLGDREERERVRVALIEARIYPAVLWDLEGIAGHRERFAGSCAVGDRLLAIHCDARYTAADMQRVAAAVLAL